MAQFNALEIRSSFRGCVRTYYSYDDELYAGTFPEEWAKDHAPETGPKECENCRDHGFWNGVFMLYCANCAIYVYEGTRGKGASGPGEEFDIPKNRGFESAFDTYLYNVNLHDVGDTDFCDSLANAVNRYASEFIHRNPRDVLAAFARMNDELYGKDKHADEDEDKGEGEYEDDVGYFIDTNGTHMTDELFSKYDGKGYSEVDIDYVIAANNRRQAEEDCRTMNRDDFDYYWNSGESVEQYYRDIGESLTRVTDSAMSRRLDEDKCLLNTHQSMVEDVPESVPEHEMCLDDSDSDSYSDSDSDSDTDQDMPLDETVHCMICENTKYCCACDEDVIHQSVFCYTCENPKYNCNCSEESRNQTHYCLDCTKVKYNCICVGENSVYMRIARKYCMQQSRGHDVDVREDAEPEYVTLVRFVPPNKQ